MPKRPSQNLPPGERLLYWLAQAATQLREGNSISHARIADLLDVDSATVKRFEKALHWPQDIDLLVAAYAQAAGISDPRDIYQTALELWHEHGTAPHLDGDDRLTAGQQFERDLLARRSQPRGPGERAGKTSGTRKRKATS